MILFKMIKKVKIDTEDQRASLALLACPFHSPDFMRAEYAQLVADVNFTLST
jgi:hypothetical protein